MEELFFGFLGLGALFLPFYLVYRVFSKLRSLQGDVTELRARLASLERTQLRASEADIAASPTPFASHQLSTLIDLETLKKEENEKKQDPSEMMSSETETTNAHLPFNDSTPPQEHYASLPNTKTSREWEAFVGGKVFNRIGAAAIILGIGFFLKYAFDNDLIPEWLRVMLGFAAGAGLLIGAARAHKNSLEIFAQGLLGAGMGTLYLSVYASYNFYHLVSLPIAFGGMICVTALGFLLALRYDSLAIALLSWFGGFITPLLFHTETPNAVGLFSYLLFLNIGLLALVFMRDAWFVLKPMSFIATYGIALLWYADQYTTMQHFTLAITFAILYWFVFFLVDSYRAVQGISRNDALWRKFDSALNSSVSYSALFALMYDGARTWLPLCTILYGGAYFLVSQMVRVRQPEHRFAFQRYTFTAISYLFLATYQQFSREWLIIAWSVELAVIFYIGYRFKERFVIGVMTVIGFLIWVALIHLEYEFFIERISEFRFLTLAAYCTIISSFLAVALMVEQMFKEFILEKHPLYSVPGTSRPIGNFFHYAWGIQVGYLVHYFLRILLEKKTVEALPILLFEDFAKTGIYIIAHIIFFVGMAWIGKRYKWREITHISLIVIIIFIVSIFKGFAYEPATSWTLLLNMRVAMLLVGILGTIALMRIWDNSSNNPSGENDTVPKFMRPHISLILGMTLFLHIFSLLSGEASDFWHSRIMSLYTLPQGDTTLLRIRDLENAKQLTISLVWLFYATVLMVLGLMRRIWAMRIAALALAGLAILKIFLYDLSDLSTPYRIGSFIGLGVVLMLVSYLYQRFKHIIMDESSSQR